MAKVLGGLVLALVLALAAGYAVVTRGLLPANADANPSGLETWMARSSLRATLRRDAPRQNNPVALDEANVAAGLKLYSESCLVCHGGPDGHPSPVAAGLYQKPPQFAKDGVEDDPDGKIYWFVKHGVRLTGMPSFTASMSEQQLWQVVLVLKHLDALPAAGAKAWSALPSAAPR